MMTCKVVVVGVGVNDGATVAGEQTQQYRSYHFAERLGHGLIQFDYSDWFLQAATDEFNSPLLDDFFDIFGCTAGEDNYFN